MGLEPMSTQTDTYRQGSHLAVFHPDGSIEWVCNITGKGREEMDNVPRECPFCERYINREELLDL